MDTGNPERPTKALVFDVSDLMHKAAINIDRVLSQLVALGPYRTPPARFYSFDGVTPQDVGHEGDQLPAFLFRSDDGLQNQINTWLDRLGVGYHIHVSPIKAQFDDLFELRLTDQRRAEAVDMSLTDVGYGISQLLPFVVQSLASKKQIISIEQPEVHVHPRLQADIGDLLIDAIQAPKEQQFLIETHSEHLILRLLRRIRETADGELPKGHPGLTPDQLSVIYVERGEEGSKAHRLRVDESGEFIDPWPQGFFEERAEELF